MTESSDLVSLSSMDEDRFGVRTAKSLVSDSEDLLEILKFCSEYQVEFLIARCPTGCLSAAQEMERQGFFLMDTIVYFSYEIKGARIPQDPSSNVLRLARPGDGISLRKASGRCFKGYFGHYHADRRLPRDRCDEVYADWAYQACISTDPADGVLVVESEGDIAGFGTLHAACREECIGGLFGVLPQFRGRGFYRSIMIGCLNWCAGREIGRMVISTQINNLASQKLWVQLGFEPSQSFYTFHKWIVPPGKDDVGRE